MHPFWLVLVLLIVAVVTGRAVVSRRRLIKELSALARRRRLNFSPFDLIGIHDRYYNLDLIRQGHSRYAWNVLYGSTDAGLVAVFRYSYDVGFGVYQGSRHWWMAVVETPYLHDPWRAELGGTGEREGDSHSDANEAALGSFRLRTAHAATLERLRDTAVTGSLDAAPVNTRWEARGPLLVAAVPVDRDPQTPDRLLTAVCELARRLKPPAP